MDFLLSDVLGTPVWTWIVFYGLVSGLILFDLGVLHRRAHEIGLRESLGLSAFYIAAGFAFAGWIGASRGDTAALQYLTGFVLEKSLAMDNILVVATVFAGYGLPRLHQHRVLIYGILGVVVLRGIMIGVGAAMMQRFDWVLLVFAILLVVTGVRLLASRAALAAPGEAPGLRLVRRLLPVTDGLRGGRFVVREPSGGRMRLVATPLLVALVTIEIADVIFAMDSIPAVFSITADPFVVYTSNIFAILGLRALYFALAALIDRFVYLKQAIALVLIFIGAKVIAAHLLDTGTVPAWLSLGVTLAILGGGALLSVRRTRPRAAPSRAGTAVMDMRRRG